MNTNVFEQMIENSPVALLLVDRKGKIKLLNKHAERLFGYNPKELMGQPIEVLVPESVREHHPELVNAFFESPITRQMGRGRDLSAVRKDGTSFPVEVGLTPIQSDGEVMVMSSVIDITQRVKAEEHFKMAIEAAPNGMLMIDSKGTIVLTNKKTNEIFGYSPNELIGRPIDTLVPDAFKAAHPALVRSFFNNPEPRAMGIGRELFGLRKDQTLVAVEIGLQPIQTEDQVLVISSILDITQRREASIALRDKTEELEEFAYRTSHDLKTPLITINGLAECIAEDCENKDYDEVATNAAKIKSLSTKLFNLVETMLMLTKSDLQNEEMQAFDFHAFFVTFIEKYKPILAEHEVKFEHQLGHQTELIVQPTRLTQVLENLIANAVKYHDPIKDNRFVIVRTYNDPDTFHLQIQDNGMGIPENRQGEVFGMFKRFHENSVDGTGLGLHMVNKHINKLNGEIRFTSSTDGTTFYLKFPIKKIMTSLPADAKSNEQQDNGGTCPVAH